MKTKDQRRAEKQNQSRRDSIEANLKIIEAIIEDKDVTEGALQRIDNAFTVADNTARNLGDSQIINSVNGYRVRIENFRIFSKIKNLEILLDELKDELKFLRDLQITEYNLERPNLERMAVIENLIVEIQARNEENAGLLRNIQERYNVNVNLVEYNRLDGVIVYAINELSKRAFSEDEKESLKANILKMKSLATVISEDRVEYVVSLEYVFNSALEGRNIFTEDTNHDENEEEIPKLEEISVSVESDGEIEAELLSEEFAYADTRISDESLRALGQQQYDQPNTGEGFVLVNETANSNYTQSQNNDAELAGQTSSTYYSYFVSYLGSNAK